MFKSSRQSKSKAVKKSETMSMSKVGIKTKENSTQLVENVSKRVRFIGYQLLRHMQASNGRFQSII